MCSPRRRRPPASEGRSFRRPGAVAFDGRTARRRPCRAAGLPLLSRWRSRRDDRRTGGPRGIVGGKPRPSRLAGSPQAGVFRARTPCRRRSLARDSVPVALGVSEADCRTSNGIGPELALGRGCSCCAVCWLPVGRSSLLPRVARSEAPASRRRCPRQCLLRASSAARPSPVHSRRRILARIPLRSPVAPVEPTAVWRLR